VGRAPSDHGAALSFNFPAAASSLARSLPIRTISSRACFVVILCFFVK
jgi:hypothetical protein